MSTRSLGPLQAAARPRPWISVLALVVLVLQAACATGRTLGGPVIGMQSPSLMPLPSSETRARWKEEPTAREAERVVVALPVDFRPVEVTEEQFTSALAELVLTMPLRVARAPAPLSSRHALVLATGQLPSHEWQVELTQDYGGFCARRGTHGDCLELFDNGPHWEDKDKSRIAVALAVGPALEALDEELRGILSPDQLWKTVSISISAYIALLFIPEPTTKALAGAFGLLLWAYLGWELIELGRAYLQLRAEAAQAHTWLELREVGARFGKAIGPRSVRILLMVGTATLGSTATLMSKAPKLPGFAAAVSRAQAGGVRLEAALPVATEAHVAVVEGSFTVVLPANALAMAAGKRRASSSSDEESVPQHHIATVENKKATWNGGPWTPRFKELFDKGGLSMEDAANKVPLPGHKGPHPEAYHAEVYRRLDRVTKHCGTNKPQCREALVEELDKIQRELKDKDSGLRKLLDGIPLTE